MEQILDFLNELMMNNNRQWFTEHKAEYSDAKARFDAFALRVIEGVAEFDPATRGLTLADCTYRIYRDVRFSADKSPYKRHMGVFVCPKGKKSGLAGYYFHLEPDGAEYIGGCGLFTGMYNPSPAMVKNIREAILFDGKNFEQSVAKAKNFHIDTDSMMARVPQGFPKDSPYAGYLRLRSFGLSMPAPKDILFGNEDALLKWTLENFKTSFEFNQFLNRAVEIVE